MGPRSGSTHAGSPDPEETVCKGYIRARGAPAPRSPDGAACAPDAHGVRHARRKESFIRRSCHARSLDASCPGAVGWVRSGEPG
ncbi:Hypothetical protein CAP_1195 [Chondromyces apiculatus DSM 436]|uniref:Uncharacterized protein n=1 Tax=Chondromyces apiculatus DSM 436 TaxID=1192034 RepID=A0A017TDD9_9BACT|nr:Hypothetical protein CAP_1195 [Chondromyces apiculatus DSM 436]